MNMIAISEKPHYSLSPRFVIRDDAGNIIKRNTDKERKDQWKALEAAGYRNLRFKTRERADDYQRAIKKKLGIDLECGEAYSISF